MFFDACDYIDVPRQTDNLEADVKALFLKNQKEKTFTHVMNVSKTNLRIAEQFDLHAEICQISALLHDISAVMTPADMLAYAETHGFTLCEAECKYPFLLHQRLSAKIAEDYFAITDKRVLSAISCHTTLKDMPSKYDMALFLADKLSWDQDGTPPFYAEVSEALQVSLEKACHVYMTYINRSGTLLFPHTNWELAFEWLNHRNI